MYEKAVSNLAKIMSNAGKTNVVKHNERNIKKNMTFIKICEYYSKCDKT